MSQAAASYGFVGFDQDDEDGDVGREGCEIWVGEEDFFALAG